MNKTFWIGLVAIFVLMQGISFLVHGVMLADTYESLQAVFRGEEQMTSMMHIFWVTSAVSLFFFCFIYIHGVEDGGALEGMRFGLLMGLFFAIPAMIDQHVIYPVPASLAITWMISSVVSFAIAGAVFGLIYKPSPD